jgi:hypothetical protein
MMIWLDSVGSGYSSVAGVCEIVVILWVPKNQGAVEVPIFQCRLHHEFSFYKEGVQIPWYLGLREELKFTNY